MKIDAHHHFWKYNAEEYPWLSGEMAALQRDFLPEHLKKEIARAGIDGVVSVQARQKIEETEWLLSLAEKNDFIRGVVGWVPLADANVKQSLEKFSTNKKLKAVRHVVQSEPDDRFVLRADFNRGVELLKDFGLAYDILIFERQLQPAIEFVDRHPDQIFVLDHLAKPRIKERVMEPWKKHIRELAERENVFCKISGMATEADWKKWSAKDLKPYFDAVLEAFGAKRLLFGSDWPVCLAATSYSHWKKTVDDFSEKLSSDEKTWLFGKTAAHAYKLDEKIVSH